MVFLYGLNPNKKGVFLNLWLWVFWLLALCDFPWVFVVGCGCLLFAVGVFLLAYRCCVLAYRFFVVGDRLLVVGFVWV